jgi:PBP1b-binding outer membrane lipoprotein LpoB
MKKTIFTAIAIATMFVVSCNSNGTNNAVPNTDSTKNVVDSTHVIDTDSTHVITIDTSHCAD